MLAPGIDPKKDIKVNKMQGLFIALNGFLFSTSVEIVESSFVGWYRWHKC